ncbi:DUF3147 family protein [Clostridium botulinum]|nr:DUF3147 family protein [Clostridium botulinum]
MFTVVKVFISAIIIGVVTEIARKSPTYGGIIAALPIVSLLSLTWIYIQGEQTQNLSKFAFGVLKGFPATIILLLVIGLSLRVNRSLVLSIFLGACGWGVILAVQNFIFN